MAVGGVGSRNRGDAFGGSLEKFWGATWGVLVVAGVAVWFIAVVGLWSCGGPGGGGVSAVVVVGMRDARHLRLARSIFGIGNIRPIHGGLRDGGSVSNPDRWLFLAGWWFGRWGFSF